MSELPPVSLPDEAPPPPEHNVVLRVFWRAFLVAVLLPFVLIMASYVLPAAEDALIIVGVFGVILVPLVLLVACVVQFVRSRREAALGLLFAGLAAPVVGFGSCYLALMLAL